MKIQSIYRGYWFPPAVFAHTVWLYHRFALSLRDVEDLLAERGVTASSRRFGNGVPLSAHDSLSASKLGWKPRLSVVS